MFLARIEGTITATVKHATLAGSSLLIGRRLEGGICVGEPLVISDVIGAPRGAVVMVTTDGGFQASLHGSTCPARLTAVGLVD